MTFVKCNWCMKCCIHITFAVLQYLNLQITHTVELVEKKDLMFH